MLILEGAQAGLSWITVLKRRESYRRAFEYFEIARVARWGERQIAKRMTDPGIIRNRAKLEAAVANARGVLAIAEEHGSFDDFLWGYVAGRPVRNRWRTSAELPASTTLSAQLSGDLKRRGFGFVGPTICYAFMQAVGLVDDHLASCFRARRGGSQRAT
jgi:DNA-3-methyladenine glycosylase I